MSFPEGDRRPRLRPGCRLEESAEDGPVLLIPEGVLKLNGPGPSIVKLCDGSRTFTEIIRALQARYPSADPSRVEQDTLKFIARLQEKNLVELV